MEPLRRNVLVKVQREGRLVIQFAETARAAFQMDGHLPVNICSFANSRERIRAIGRVVAIGGIAAQHIQAILFHFDFQTRHPVPGEQVGSGSQRFAVAMSGESREAGHHHEQPRRCDSLPTP